MAILTCEHCHQEFKCTKRVKTRRYCSKRCLAFARHAKRGHGYKPMTCEACGKTVMLPSFYAKVQKFCSRACYVKRKTKYSRTFNCAYCGQEVIRNEGGYGRGTAKFCSVRCRSEFRRKDGSITSQGYRVQSVNGKPVLEHRIIMEKTLGRALRKDENIHHKNGQRLDNSVDNLELWSKAQPSGQRVDEKIAWCIWFLEQYGFQVSKVGSFAPDCAR